MQWQFFWNMDFGHPGKSGGGTSWGATLGAGGRGVMRAAAGGNFLLLFFQLCRFKRSFHIELWVRFICIHFLSTFYLC